METTRGVRQVEEKRQPFGLELRTEVPTVSVAQLEAAQGPKLDHEYRTVLSKEALPAQVTDC